MPTGDSIPYTVSGNTSNLTGYTAQTIQTQTYGTLGQSCEMLGHRIERWAEYLDGECVATCGVCAQRVSSKRMPGGIPFMRLKALVELLIAMPGDSELFLEINEVNDLLDAEQRSLDEAKALLATARKMAGCGD